MKKLRYCDENFSESLNSTIAMDFKSKIVYLKKDDVSYATKLSIWDSVRSFLKIHLKKEN